MTFTSWIASRPAVFAGAAGLFLAACSQPQQMAKASSDMGTGGQQQSAWRSLFDGRSLAAWRGYQKSEVPAGWKVGDGTFYKEDETEDIITRDQFGDFELEFEWKVGKGGNAGVFYRATEEYDHIYWSATEYQLLDDPNARDGRSPLTSAGANYGLYPSIPGVVKPAGEWNSSRIIARGSHAEHWLNGQKLLEYDYGSPEWEAKVKASKFKDWPNYGRARKGHIGIQGDHTGVLAFRNVRIRELR
jgi:hypothetical protein